MADDARHTRPDLTPEARAARSDFFELLRRLETEELRFGRAGGAGREPARLGQGARLTFATSGLASIDGPASADGPPRVTVNLLGLIGPEGPMPLHITRWITERLSNRWFPGGDAGATADTAFLDFVNLLQHRMLSLYWRAWADARAEVQVAHGAGGQITAMMAALSGQGMPGTAGTDARISGAKLRHATSLARQVRSPARLTAFLETVLEVPVSLEEFSAGWIYYPDHLQTRLGAAHAGLGTGAVAGARGFDRQSRAQLRLGPMPLKRFSQLMDDPEAHARLRHALSFVAGQDLVFTVRLVLQAGEVPCARLGHSRLGRTAWLRPVAGRDADDLCLPLAAAGAQERRAAA